MKKSIFLIFVLTAILSSILLFHEKILESYAKLFVVSNATKGADIILILAGRPQDRVLKAIEAYKKGYGKKICYTDPINYLSELKYPEIFLSQQEIIKKTAEKESVKVYKIPSLKEKGVTSTFDEAYDTAAYAKKHSIKHIILVTSTFHSRRALYAFKKIFKKVGIPANIEVYLTKKDLKKVKGWWRREVDISALVTEPFKMVIYFFRASNLKSIKER